MSNKFSENEWSENVLNWLLLAQELFDVPCQEMPDINYKHLFYYRKVAENETKVSKIVIQFPQRGKIISQSRAIDGQTLIGNIGGYIGLLLGA